MAERPAIKARVLSRREIEALTSDPRLVRALEAIFGDVSATLPDASLANAQAAEGAQSTADQAVQDAAQAQSTANQAVQDAATAQQAADDAQEDIDAHEALTAAHGTTGAVVGTTDTQTLTNKTLAAGTKLSGQTLAPGTGTPTLGTAGPVGAPSTWLKFNINGTDYVLPLWLA